jgi:hypothetical protein
MLRRPATPALLQQWQAIWQENRPLLQPNRKSGAQVLTWLEKNYPLTPLLDDNARQVVADNVLLNEPHRQKLPPGVLPQPLTFTVDNRGAGAALYAAQLPDEAGQRIFVGLDLVSGYYTVEGSCRLWDEMFAFRGLDQADLENCYLVAEYIGCRERCGQK